MCKLDVIKALGYWGDPEDAQDLPLPEAAPGSVSVGNLSVTVQDEERSESNLPSSSSSEFGPHRPCLKEDAEEDTALLGAGRSDPQHGGSIC